MRDTLSKAAPNRVPEPGAPPEPPVQEIVIDEIAEYKLGGLLLRKARWGLSFRGWLLLLVVTLGAALIGLQTIHPFLSVTDKAGHDVLIVEGWVPSPTLKQAAAEFQSGRYQHVLVVRGVYDSTNQYESGRYYGDYVANLLVEHGIPSNAVTTVFCSVVRKDRTYHQALAARQWLADNKVSVKSLDVATLAPHARRSRLLYEEAFGDDTHIGVIALEDLSYNASRWWRSSEGVREVLGETIAYVYARVLFRPPARN